jgi:hypothetical protein
VDSWLKKNEKKSLLPSHETLWEKGAHPSLTYLLKYPIHHFILFSGMKKMPEFFAFQTTLFDFN